MADEVAGHRDQQEEQNRDAGENFNKRATATRVLADVQAVVDDRRQGADQRDQAGRVEPVQQRAGMARKRVQHDGGRHVGDNLADQDAADVLVPTYGARQKAGDRLVRRDRRGEDEEAQEGQDQHVVAPKQHPPVEQQDRGRDRGGDVQPPRCAANDHRDHHRKQGDIQHPVQPPLPRQAPPEGLARNVHRLGRTQAKQPPHEQQKQRARDQPDRQHIRDKPPCADPRLPEDKEVLWTAERGQQ